MARKKRKAIKSPQVSRPVPLAETGGLSAWGLPALGWVALVFSWLAALGGVSDGSIDWRNIFEHDTVRVAAVFRDMFGGEGYPAFGWWVAHALFYFPDYAFQWPLLALGLDMTATLYIFPLLQVGFAAAGWILVCDFLFGKSPVRRAAVLLLYAASFLLLAWGQSQVFIMLMLSVWHYGAWTCVPWLLWFSLRLLNSPRPGPGKIAALVFASAVAAASDLLSVLWFALPAVLAALPSAKLNKFAVFASVLAAGVALGVAVDHMAPWEGRRGIGDNVQLTRASLIDRLNVIIVLGLHLRDFVLGDPLEFIVMLAFAAALFTRLWREFKRFRAKKAKREEFHPRLFVLLLIPISIAACVAATINHGHIHTHYHVHGVTAMRYMMPFFFFPLFVGWTLLEWKDRSWKVRPAALAAAACAAAVGISAPKLARIDFAAMDPFATPFQKCFAENAKRLGWTSGIGSVHFSLLTFLNPDAGMENYTWVGTEWREAGQSSLVMIATNANPHRRGKEAQFVTANAHNGAIFVRTPRAGDKGCSFSNYGPCLGWENRNVFITDDAVAGAFGEPTEVVECAGIGLYHYDPPLRIDSSEFQEWEEIGRRF